jgi:hypothetical protein
MYRSEDIPKSPSQESRPKVILLGSGPYYRATAAQCLHEQNYEIVFVHPDRRGVDLINQRGSYSVVQRSNGGRQLYTVTRCRALHLVTDLRKIVHEIATAHAVLFGAPELTTPTFDKIA